MMQDSSAPNRRHKQHEYRRVAQRPDVRALSTTALCRPCSIEQQLDPDRKTSQLPTNPILAALPSDSVIGVYQ
jgi:hypothetical protein